MLDAVDTSTVVVVDSVVLVETDSVVVDVVVVETDSVVVVDVLVTGVVLVAPIPPLHSGTLYM